MKQLLIVRHGQTDWNAQGLYQGASDVELNHAGRRQALEIASRLGDRYAIDVIVSSPLRRAVETAEIIASVLSLNVHTMDQFAERNAGVYEGLTPAEAKTKYPEVWAQNITRQLHMAPPGGETILEVGARVLDGLRELRARFAGKHVLLVAHGYVARMLFGIIRQVPDEEFHGYRLENGEVTEYRF
jgi:probable phosphoglycerate mutase